MVVWHLGKPIFLKKKGKNYVMHIFLGILLKIGERMMKHIYETIWRNLNTT